MRYSYSIGNAALLILLAITATYANAHDVNVKKFVYSGDGDARSVCMSIARDKVPSLKGSLRRYRLKPIPTTTKAFRCNNLELDQFALSMNAVKSSKYLEKYYPRGKITIDEVVAGR